MKKIIAPGIVAGFVTLVVGVVISSLFVAFPSVLADYQNMMRPWSDPLIFVFALYPLLQGIMFAWVWDKTKNLFSGTTMERGARAGVLAWAVAILPGLLANYSGFPLSLLTIVSWGVNGLVCAVISGMIFAKMNA